MAKRIVASLICFTFISNNLQLSQAQDFNINQLPLPGAMIEETAPFLPLTLKGLIVNFKKPLEFQFIVDTGDSSVKGFNNAVFEGEAFKKEANRLVKYFLAGLTIPEGELWVNLSPYEKGRITTRSLGQTELGRDLLAQDYILKQLSASLIYPEKGLGKEFWSRVYARVRQQFGTTNVPINTFNKVWILPDQAQVFESDSCAYVTKSTLKVMLDEDYLALSKQQPETGGHVQIRTTKNVSPSALPTIASQTVREIIIPEIEKEVNSGKNFAPLRQIFNAMILSKWYKETIQNGLLDAVYTNKKKTAGINLTDLSVKEQIYNRYLQAYKKGVFNYIKEEIKPNGQGAPRKYFSGGISQLGTFQLKRIRNSAMISKVKGLMLVSIVLFGLSGAVFANQTKTIELPPKSTPVMLKEPDINEKIVALQREFHDHGFVQGFNFELDKIRDRNAVPGLVRLLKDPNSNVRQIAIKVLGKIGDNEAVPALLEALQNPDPLTSQASAVALREIGDRAVLPDLLIALNSAKAGFVRSAILEAIGSLGDKSVIPEVIEAELNESDISVIATAKRVRTKLGGATKEQMVIGYINLLSSANRSSRLMSLKQLGRLGDKNAIEPIKRHVLEINEFPENKSLNFLERISKDIADNAEKRVAEQALRKLGVGSYNVVRISKWTVAVAGGFLVLLGVWKAFSKRRKNDPAMRAMSQTLQHFKNDASGLLAKNGGIDFNQINVERTGKVIKMQFDPIRLNALMRNGFQGFTPVIVNITRISSPLQLLGIGQAKESEVLAKI